MLTCCPWPAGGKLHAVKLDEAAKLLRYYCGKIQEACQATHLPSKVAAAAVIYLQRVYVSCSVLDHNPEALFLPCIYLACKVCLDPTHGDTQVAWASLSEAGWPAG